MSWRENFAFCSCDAQRVVAVGRPSDRELPGGVAVEATAPQVAARDPGVGRLEQTPVVEVDRGLHRLRANVGVALALLRERRVVVAQRDVGPRREPLDRADEVEMLDFANERDRIAALFAAEAVARHLSRG